MNLYVENATLNFANGLFEMSAPKGITSKPKYNCHIILSKGYKLYEMDSGKRTQISPVDAVKKEAQIAWAGRAEAMLKTIEKSKNCLRDGDEKLTSDGSVWQGYENSLYFALKNTVKPTTINKDRSQVTREDNILTSGCKVNAFFEVKVQKEATKKSIYGTIKGVQYVGEGTDMGVGGVVSSEAFDNISDLEDGALE
jgi:Protein of unknown function (DUF2815)